MNQRRLAILESSPSTLEDSRTARVLAAETLAAEAQNARAGGGSRHCVLTTRTVESLAWGWRGIVDGSDGFVAGVGCGFSGVLAGCAVRLTAQYFSIGRVIVRFGSDTCVAHGVGDIGQAGEIGEVLLGLPACMSIGLVRDVGETPETLQGVEVGPCCRSTLTI